LSFCKVSRFDHDERGVGKVVVERGLWKKMTRERERAQLCKVQHASHTAAANGEFHRTGGCVIFKFEPFVETRQTEEEVTN
jgi:hypothetical protein